MSNCLITNQQAWKTFVAFRPTPETVDPMEIVLKDNSLNINKIIEYTGDTSNFKANFTPQTWGQFIGQDQAKDRAKFIIKKIKKGMKAHFLVDGIKGHGKTSYVDLLAKDINAHVVKRIGKQVNEDNLVDIINEINSSKSANVVLFIDEFDTMEWQVIKILNPILESFEVSGKKIKPFIFAGATINKYTLIKNNPDTLDRIPTHIKFVRYKKEELSTILKQYHVNVYSNEPITDGVYDSISQNCKYNPRTAIALLSDYVVEGSTDKVFDSWGIVEDGLTQIDMRILSTLNNSTRPIGANCLALKCGLNEKEYITEFEPFLLEFGYINRVPSRMITEKGKEILNHADN